MKNVLWYKKQPQEWMEGLPIGNGRLAAMVCGDEVRDKLSLNHEWLWRGVHRNRDNKPAAKYLSEIRQLLKDGDFFRATSVANTYLGGMGGISKIKNRVDAYQPAGDLVFEVKDARFLKRQLDIDNALVTIERMVNESIVTSSFIAHPVANLIIGRWHAAAGQFSGCFKFSRTEDGEAQEQLVIKDNIITFNCSFIGGIKYIVQVSVRSDGRLQDDGASLTVDNATYVMAYVNIATSESGMDQELSRYPIPDTCWDKLLSSHSEAFSAVFGRMTLDVDLPDLIDSTDNLIAAAKRGELDPALVLLYFHYGRYLLISSSICGELPANLQGKWNDSITPAWDCDYHFDINLQMNYWMAEVANMPECAEALLKYVERFVPHAKKAAMDLYACRGIWLPIQTDAWGRATPESFGWSVWIGAAPWIAQHFWWHYVHSGNVEFLKERAYPFFKEVATFYEDYLVEDADGILQIMPSQSPENRFEGTGLWPVSIGISAAMDVQLAYDVFRYAIESAEILEIDSDCRDRWLTMQKKLPPFAIGSDGRLLEWDVERKELEPGHRHLSHLYGLFPSDRINPVDTPAEYRAAIKSLEYRLAQGGGHTGWSRAWVGCLSARINDRDGLWQHLAGLIKDFATISLLDLHPPRIFQIEGNLGAVAAILAGLVQSFGGKVHLLRALPEAWPTGRVSGIKVPGGHQLNISWDQGEVTELEVTIGYSRKLVLADLGDRLHNIGHGRLEASDIHLEGSPGEKIMLSSII